MLSVFWDIQGVVHMEFMPKSTTINSVRYYENLTKLKAQIQRVCPYIEQPLLQHDNARLHTGAMITAWIQSLGSNVVDHPPYSPNLAPSDFHLFSKLEHLRGRDSDNAVQTEVRLCFRHQSEGFYNDGIKNSMH